MLELHDSELLKFHRKYCHFETSPLGIIEIPLEILSFWNFTTQNHLNSMGNIVILKLHDSESLKFHGGYYHFRTSPVGIIEIQ